jgi:hypothetical protein
MSTFRNALVFFDQLGVYDVVLPFLLIFTLVFAMLEKTKVFGGQSDTKTRKNLNAMVAFCTGFLVVASSQLVYVINATIAKSMVLLVMGVLFIMLIGSFKKDEATYLKGGWEVVFMIIMFVGISLILLYNLGWLQAIYLYTASNLSGPVVGAFALLIIVLAFMAFIYKTPEGEQKKSEN